MSNGVNKLLLCLRIRVESEKANLDRGGAGSLFQNPSSDNTLITNQSFISIKTLWLASSSGYSAVLAALTGSRH